MNDIKNERGNKFADTLKWYAAGCAVSLLIFYAMQYFGMEMRNIAFCFQVSAGVFLGGMLQMRARRRREISNVTLALGGPKAARPKGPFAAGRRLIH